MVLRRVLVAMVLTTVALSSSPAAQSPQDRPMQADGVLRLLTDLEGALTTNNVDELVRLTSTSLPTLDFRNFVATSFGDGQDTAAVRERDRRTVPTGFMVLVEMLIGRGGVGRIATWQLLVQPRGDETGRYELAGMTPVASVDGLVQLALDTSQQFAARDLVFTAPGLTLHLSSGVVFLARVAEGATALVFRGKGQMRFAPDDPAEQVQVRAFSGKAALEDQIEEAFIRISPAEFSSRLSQAQLVPVATDPRDLQRALDLFEDYATRSYTLNLGDLTSDRWSLLPPDGDVLAELRTDDFGTLTYVRAKDDPEDVSLFDRAKSRNISVYASAERLERRGPYYNEDDGAAYDVEHYAIDVRMDPEREWISGRGSLRIKTKRDGLATLSLRLAQSFNVSSVSSPEFGRLLALRVSGQSSVLVSLPAMVPAGTELSVDIYYSGRLPSQNIEREAITVDADQQQVQDPFAIERTILPEPRYLYSNRSYWYPQAPITDFATASIEISVPVQFQVVASGSLVSSVVSPGNDQAEGDGDGRTERTVRFLADRPVRYVACLISRFVPVGQAAASVQSLAPATPSTTSAPGTVNVDVVATPRLLRSNRALPERTAKILEFFADQIGEAPYPDFSLAAMDAQLPSGHSPAYFAAWNQATLPTNLTWRSDPVALDGYQFFFLAHEVAHQWWGQAVGWKNYHEQWLSEGLAQYFAAAYAGHDKDAETERRLFLQMRESALDLSKHGPIDLGYRLGHVQGDARIFRGLVYNKAAVVMHMLRRLVGQEAFTRGIQRFFRENRFKKAGADDLRLAFEVEAGQSLERFFERWIHGFTLPELRLTWRMADAGHVAVRVEQLGETFDLPLTVTIRLDGGQEDQVTMVITSKIHDVLIPVAGEVRRVDTRDDTSLVTIRR